VWNNNRVRLIVAALSAMAFALNGLAIANEDSQSPQLLLTPKLLRRLQRDRTRQTVRWLSFEKRVETVPDSPERGFELALFYAVTHDETRGKEATAWALAHKNETRQVALVLDWARDAMSPEQVHELLQLPQNPVKSAASARLARDFLFKAVLQATFDQNLLDRENRYILKDLHQSYPVDPTSLYAAVEYLMVLRNVRRTDLRDADPRFFSSFPQRLLLSLTPEQVERPDWRVHEAALALVTLDPNLTSSQFLQAWAMEDSQIVHEGPGVAYEFMWADPYLPGIAYQNMDPWIYDSEGSSLFARLGWNVDTCWIAVVPGKFDQRNCPAQGAPTNFGSLHLLSLPANCIELPVRTHNETILFWKLKPGAELFREHDRQRVQGTADMAGMWLAPNDTGGRVCEVLKAHPTGHH
jgi:hypothetical protein